MVALSIVHVLSSFGLGGLERVALELARGQADDGHHVLTVSLSAQSSAQSNELLMAEFSDAGLETDIVPIRRSRGFDVSVPIRLGKLFRQRRASVVHTHNPQPLVMSALAARGVGATLVHTKHGVNPDSPRRMLLRRLAGRLVHRFVAVSESTAEIARKQRECAAKRLTVIPNGINTDRFLLERSEYADVRDELGIAADDFLILTVGQLRPEKGHKHLIHSLQPLLKQPGVRLVIAGDGIERKPLESLIVELKLTGKVHLLGNRCDIPALVAAANLFVLSSIREGLPLVIPEAMAGGLAVVSTSVGGIPRVVCDGKTGFLVEPGDSHALLERCRHLRDNRELAQRMGEAGRIRSLAEYSCARMVADYAKLYKEARQSG